MRSGAPRHWVTGDKALSGEPGRCFRFVTDPDGKPVNCPERPIASGWLKIGDRWTIGRHLRTYFFHLPSHHGLLTIERMYAKLTRP